MKEKSYGPKQFILILVLVLSWSIASFIRFPKEHLLAFGFTRSFTTIADVSLSEGRYATRLADGVVIDEVQREPLYPLSLMLVKYCTKDYALLVWVQLLCMIISLFLWGLFSLDRFGWLAMLGFFFLMFWAIIPAFYTSILYPYAFQFLLITTALLLLVKSIHTHKILHFILAGLCMGGAMCERAAYSLLAVFVSAALLALCKPLHIRKHHILAFTIPAYLLPLPWLLRNYSIGVYGINQMSGYTLGYTYGYLPGGEHSDYESRYRRYIRARGPDRGTLSFIADETLAGNGSYQSNDKKLAALVLKKMKANTKLVAKMISMNLRSFPCRLGNTNTGKFSSATFQNEPRQFYGKYACRRITTFSDFAVLSLALLGLCLGLRRLEPFAVIGGLLLIYTVSFSTTIVIFDPRYRGALDAVLYIFASREAALFIVSRFKAASTKTPDKTRRKKGRLHKSKITHTQ